MTRSMEPGGRAARNSKQSARATAHGRCPASTSSTSASMTPSSLKNHW